jgi:hypothetical protein
MKPLIFSLILSGCLYNNEYPNPPQMLNEKQTMSVCLNIPDKEEGKASIEDWNKALNGFWKFEIIETNCDIEVSIVDDPSNESKLAAAYSNVFFSPNPYIVFYKNKYSKEKVHGVLIHELGHILGAYHLQGTTMDPGYNPYHMECPDEATMVQVAAAYHVKPENFKPCENNFYSPVD